MSGIQLKSISHHFGDLVLLNNIDLSLSADSRIALSGANGSGKSTLMKIIYGIIPPSAGSIVKTKGIRVSYLPQTGLQFKKDSLYQEADKAFDRFKDIEHEKQETEKKLASAAENNSAVASLVEKQDHLQEILITSGYYNRESEIERILTGLGFSQSHFSAECRSFSGGWQMRIALAKILLEKPDILLLDEPTNYLDLEARNWLEGFLQNYHGGFMIVSHDRYFLDITVNQVAELFNGNLKLYRGNYTDYEILRDKELETLLKQYEKQQAEIKKAEDFIRRFRYNASKAALAQSKIKWLEKLDLIQIPENLKKLSFSFPPAPHSGQDVLQISGLSKKYGDHEVINNLNFTLTKGEKIVVTGINGAGKSTLLRIIAGQDSCFKGEIKYGKGVKIGYFSCDEINNHLLKEKQVIQIVETEAPAILQPKLRDLLGAFLFRGDDIYKPVSVLSGGEQSRLSLLLLLLKPVNLLILDEPTNHLDLQSKEMLLRALKKYSGSLMFVSHDRFFIQQLADKVLELGDKQARLFYGNYNYYLDRINQEQENQNQENNIKNTGILANNKKYSSGKDSNNASSSKEEQQLQKAQKNRLRRLKQTEHELIQKIEELDKEHETIHKQMSLPEMYESGECMKKLKQQLTDKELKKQVLFEQWETINQELLATAEKV